MKIRNLIFAVALTAVSGTSFAADFQTLPTDFPDDPALSTDAITFCYAAEDLDSAIGCKITNGIVTGSDLAGNLYALPDGSPAIFPDNPVSPSIVLTEIASNSQDILVDGSFIGLSAGLVNVGTLTDYVLRDTRDNKLVFAMRAVLNPTVNGTANQYEINNLFRTGFTGFSAAIGWSRGSDADLRMYNGARTAQKFLSSAPLSYDPDIVRLHSDVNVSEGNARSGYFFIKTDAINYSTSANVISLYQAGEEGQPLNEVFFTGFVPSLLPDTPDTPAIYPESDTFHSHIAVSLDSTQPGAPIYYTLDGSDPTSASTPYSKAFLLESSATVKAIVIQGSGETSPIATKDYTVLNKAVWTPIPSLSWQWQLQGDFDNSVSARVYNLDLFDTPAETIETLQSTGHRVICYLNAGAWEQWRDDAGDFPESVKGNNVSGFADEKWLDIRDIEDLKPVMQARLDLAVSKGCDAVEPDNVDGYTHVTGFALTSDDQIHYNLWLSNQANARGLSIGLKNDLDQIPALEPFFDWALNEQCIEFNECDALEPFITSNKAVFGVEYLTATHTPNISDICSITDAKQYSWLIKTPELDSSVVDSCADYYEFVDVDNDGVIDNEDNCLAVDNINQRDTDNDGFGNQCDADLNNDGITSIADFVNFKSKLFTTSPDTDLNGDGVVNIADFVIFRSLYLQPPGPAAGH